MTTRETAETALTAAGFSWDTGEECWVKAFGSGMQIACVTVSLRERGDTLRVVVSDTRGGTPRRLTVDELVATAASLAPAGG